MHFPLRTGPASSSYAAHAYHRYAFRNVLVGNVPSYRHTFTTFGPLARVQKKGKPNPYAKARHLKQGAPFINPRYQEAQSRLNKLGEDGSDGSKKSKQSQREATKTYGIFRNLTLGRYDLLMNTSNSWGGKQEEYKSFGLNSKLDFDREVKLFRNSIERACDLASEKNAISKTENPLFWGLRNAFVENDIVGLTDELTYGFQNFLMRSRFPKNIAATHKKIADFRFPYEWFPATRAMQRTIHLHVGPTNSGKTYNALKALENSKSGIYAGPLRLLAHEVYTRFNAKGKTCALITGEEQRIPEDQDNYFRSCTVEMTPLNLPVDVAVIDEIQMIGDAERGWAWTQAVLGVQAKEVHLCGEERAVELIQSLCATIGDECIVTRYNRLSPLKTMDTSLDNYSNLEKGDAVITFSRVAIHAIKNQIEKTTGRRCAMVYGSLPPEIRAQQAALFNDPDNDYDFLVASDAIGMGLNLEIKRIIFEQTHKRTKTSYRQISVSEIKQIGGRAGRYRTARQATQSESTTDANGEETIGTPPPKTGQPGLVTTLEKADLSIVKKAFSREPEPILSAGIQPPPSVIERFSSYFPPNTPFSYIISRLRDIARVSPRFHMCGLKEMLAVSDYIQPYPMSVYDRCVFLNAPVYLADKSGVEILQAFARCVSNMEGGELLDIPGIDLELLDTVEEATGNSPENLRRLESLHKTITLYLWLSYRYSGVFRSQNLAFHVKELVEARIDAHLAKVSVDTAKRRARLEKIRQQASKSERKKERVLGGDASIDGPGHEIPGEWNEEGHEEPLYDSPDELEPITRLEPHTKKNEAARRA
ncbi:P-loop containing nucleoside triphosphate hydrolase protein [Daldinia vernicosa]|uniref:P-loop containing nucleoside triphosphate hydrolase protein n=1 Tax=Daldinia vernicosa TaxID=114800 RepID=UPI002007E2A9|nr:P-loop containing nucleoside triphosphate hydrolase protein [Daldinia vernicosa]KAI0853004.1 P-loop containing nucleoside triphosphate hydrolase protein [Daldinia vernicosa]